MKKIVTIIAIIASINSSQAQTNYTPAGTWKYINGADTIEMFFKTDQLQAGTKIFPTIIGFHKYIKNGVLIENTLQFSNTTYSGNKSSILIYNSYPTNTKLEGRIRDITLSNDRMLGIHKINPTTMNVTLAYIHGVRNNRPYGFTLPKSFQLTKQ